MLLIELLHRPDIQRMRTLTTAAIVLVLGITVYGQTEVLTNAKVIEMTKAGLSTQIILAKIETSIDRFDVGSDALIEMKKAGVADDVIAAIVEKCRNVTNCNDNGLTAARGGASIPVVNSARAALLNARTITIQKSSLNPSRQALEKELLKRSDWRALNLTIEQYKKDADLYIDIGFVPLSLVTHRYVYRIYDRRTGAVIAAGETTSWGSLAEHLAKHICESLTKIRNSATGGLG